MTLFTLIAIGIAYLFGSISSAIVVCRLMHLPDPRTQGSRNPGATNVLRIGGKLAAGITLFGDAVKGVVPVLLAKWLGMDELGLALVTLAVFMGHLYPVFFGFEGGKGVATLIGCLLALSWPVGLCWGVTWLVMAVVFRYSSLAALTASILSPVYIWYFTQSYVYVVMLIIMVALLFYRHRANIKKLLAGQESKLYSK